MIRTLALVVAAASKRLIDRDHTVARGVFAGGVLVAVLAGTGAAAFADDLKVPRAIVATVNGEAITNRDLDLEVRREIKLRGVPDEQLAEARHVLRPQILESMITHRLIQQQCDLFKILPSDGDIDRFLRWQVDESRDVSSLEEYFRRMLQMTGDDEETIRKQARDEIRRRLLFREHVYREEYISPRELREYYGSNRERFHEAAKYKIRYLTIPITPDLAKTLESLNADFEKKVPFDELIAKYAAETDRNSSAWEITDAELDQMLDPLPRLIRELKVGEVTPRLDFPAAVRFVRLEAKTLGKALAFDTQKAQVMIRNAISQDRRDRQVNRYLSELLAKNIGGIRKFVE